MTRPRENISIAISLLGQESNELKNRPSKQKPRNAGYLRAGAYAVSALAALGSRGDAAAIIETKTGADAFRTGEDAIAAKKTPAATN